MNDDNNDARDDSPIDGQQTEKDQTVFGGTASPKQADVMEKDLPSDSHRRSHSRSKSSTRARGSQNGNSSVENGEVPFGRWHGEHQNSSETRHKNRNQNSRKNATRTRVNRAETEHSGSANVNANQLAHAVAHAVSHSGRAKGGASNSSNNRNNNTIQRENGNEVRNLSVRRSKVNSPPLPPHPNSPRTTTVRYIKPTDPIEDDIPTLDGRSRTIWKQRPDDVDEEKQNDIGNGETEGQHRNAHSSRPYRRFIPTSKAQGARKNTRHFTAVNEQLQSKKKKAGSGNETSSSSDGESSSEGKALRTRRLNRSEYFQFAFLCLTLIDVKRKKLPRQFLAFKLELNANCACLFFARKHRN